MCQKVMGLKKIMTCSDQYLGQGLTAFLFVMPLSHNHKRRMQCRKPDQMRPSSLFSRKKIDANTSYVSINVWIDLNR